jgi:hypothetical protein
MGNVHDPLLKKCLDLTLKTFKGGAHLTAAGDILPKNHFIDSSLIM